MTKNKSTKRALFSSMLVMLICVAMLIGTTFAWFTDSVTSGKNQIVAGNLDIDLEYTKTPDDPNSWNSVEGKTDLFDSTALWEPGHTEVVYLKLTNKGSLAVKYQFGINATDTVIGKNADGEDIKLSEHLMYGVVENQTTKFADRAAAISAVGTSSKKLSAYSVEGSMEKSADKYVALVVYMPETVGNEANYRGDAVPTVELGVNLVATQDAVERDSFDEKYDEAATYLNTDADGALVISSKAELVYFAYSVNSGNTYKGETVKLTKDIDMSGYAWTPINNFEGTFDGNGKTISNLSVKNAKYAGLFGYLKDSGATIKNVIIDGADVVAVTTDTDGYAGALVGYHFSSGGKVTIENVKVINSTVKGKNGGAVVGAVSGGYISDCTSTNNTITASRNGGIVGKTLEFGSVTGSTVSGNTQNISIFCDESYTWLGTIVGQVAGGTVEGNETSKQTVATATDNEALKDAIENGNQVITLGSGNYKIPASAQGKTLTISGTEDTKISITSGLTNISGATVTFDGVTILSEPEGAGYSNGFSHASNVIYNDCVIEGTLGLQTSCEFYNCTFNVTGDYYNVWTWGAKTATFNGCTFNCDGKALLVYGSGANDQTIVGKQAVNITNCKFNDNGDNTVTGKAAIEITNTYVGGCYSVNITNTTVNGFSTTEAKDFNAKYGSVKNGKLGTNVWGNKMKLSNEVLNVVVDGVDVY